MRIVAIISQKGGCGKTTTSINLAACLANLGQRTLLADMDPQGHCAVGLAVPDGQIDQTIYDALIEERDGRPMKLDQVIWQIASNFDLAPSNIKLAAFEQMFAGRPGREDRLMLAMEAVRAAYSWAVIDCPPGVGLLTFNALKACDQVVVPVETGYFSLHGLTKMMETLELLKERCNRDVVIRVLPTLYDTRTKLAREILSELRQKFGRHLMQSTINFNTKLKEAASSGQPITEYDPGSRGYKDFISLAREVMGQEPLTAAGAAAQKLSRPAELVYRARQLSQMASFQLGRNTVLTGSAPSASVTPAAGTLMHGSGTSTRTELQIELPTSATGAVAGRIEPARAIRAGAPAPLSIAAASLPPKTTQERIDDFYGVRTIGRETMLAVKFAQAKKVVVAGDFNGWQQDATPMETGSRSGDWCVRLPLSPGRYRYRLVVDGRWITDPYNNRVEVNQYGELNNVLEVA